MDEKTFGKLISELSLYFERKPPTQATFHAWLPEVSAIPNSAYYSLMGFVKELDVWPKNLPNFLRSKYSQVGDPDSSQYAIHPRRLHPKAYAKSGCPLCKSEGVIPWPMDWPVRRDENGELITRKFTPQALCTCTDSAEYGY